jgi:hypothetical protein
MKSLREHPTKIWNIAFKSAHLDPGLREDVAENYTIADDFKIADGLFDGTTH